MKAVTERDKVQCPYQQLQQSSIFRIQLCVNTLSKLVAFVEHFPTIRNLELVCITRPVSCLWHGWSSYSAWPFTVSVRYPWITHRLDSVVHHESLADCQLRRWRVDWVCCHVRRASRQRSGTHNLSFIYCWCHKHLRYGLNVHSYTNDTHLYVHCDAVNCAAEAARLAACNRGTRWMGIILL